MSGGEIFFVAVAFVILIAITAAAQFKWVKNRVVVFVAGVMIIVALRIAELPPDWFEGSKTGFGIVVMLMLSAFVMRGAEERAFGTPLFMGMALALLAANVVAVVANVL